MARASKRRSQTLGRGLVDKVLVVTGGAANADLTATGAVRGDEIVSAIEWNTGVPTDRTSTVTVTAADIIRSTANTTGNKLVVWLRGRPY